VHSFLGRELGGVDSVRARLACWRDAISFEQSEDIARLGARLIADGAVIGWMQGRSEFGPRALGHRSILADPRPAANRDRINACIKSREPYRPFAPAVLEERATEYFELPPGHDCAFMTFTYPVKQEKRSVHGAVTHADGTARVQTISREVAPAFWRLIHAFGEQTGVHVVLNTSFNNNSEPIVDSVDDGVVCFLTSELDALLVGDFIVRRRDLARSARELYVTLAPNVQLVRSTRAGREAMRERCELQVIGDPTRRHEVSPLAAALLVRAHGDVVLGELVPAVLTGAIPPIDADERALIGEMLDLWRQRFIRMGPR
jgi:carbamoyltransferase